MKQVKIIDKEFGISIPSEEIQAAISRIAKQMDEDLKGKNVIFIGILNGAFMFAADLFKKINIDCRITFLKIASYSGDHSTGKMKRLIGLNDDITDATVVILEDIVDTGKTIVDIMKQLKGYEPKEIKIATLLLKPTVYDKDIKLDYVGIEIPNEFIVGFGLDYDGYGRNLEDIYTLIKK